MSDAEQLLNMTLMGLRQMASDPDVARSGLQILADLGKTPGAIFFGAAFPNGMFGILH